MTWYVGDNGGFIHVPHAEPRFHRDGDPFYPTYPAPVTFRTPPFYDANDVHYRLAFRDQHPDPVDGRDLISLPDREQILSRREDPCPNPYPYPPWWHNSDNGGYPFRIAASPRHEEDDEEDSIENLEFYAPQLYSDSCARQVVESLRTLPGVENVVVDQWEKKVVVVGNGLREDKVLRRLRRMQRMERSVCWRDR